MRGSLAIMALLVAVPLVTLVVILQSPGRVELLAPAGGVDSDSAGVGVGVDGSGRVHFEEPRRDRRGQGAPRAAADPRYKFSERHMTESMLFQQRQEVLGQQGRSSEPPAGHDALRRGAAGAVPGARSGLVRPAAGARIHPEGPRRLPRMSDEIWEKIQNAPRARVRVSAMLLATKHMDSTRAVLQNFDRVLPKNVPIQVFHSRANAAEMEVRFLFSC
jgi:hypothetical protein